MTTLSKQETDLLEEKILGFIPILKSMGIQLVRIEDSRCLLRVPLALNHNHKGTAFGGSLYAACTAACYTLAYALQIKTSLVNRDLVITKGEIEYLKPITQDFFVLAEIDLLSWQTVLDSLTQKKPKRLRLKAFIRHDETGPDRVRFEGEFAFLPS